jgi:hypothetical protein
MRRQDLWRLEYQEDPYLEVLETSELKDRFLAVMDNGLFVTDELKIGMLSIAAGGGYWLASSTHLFEEFGKRGGIPGGFDQRSVPNLEWPGLSTAVRIFNDSKAKYSVALVRLGEAKYLREAFETGRIYIQPASTYADPSLNRAVRDDELQLKIYRKSSVFTRLYDEYGKALRPSGPKHGRRVETLRAPTNYFVYCMSIERSVRLFGDFKYDACLIIHQPIMFVRRLGAAGLRTLGGSWSWFAGPIEYIDPLRPPNSHLNLVHCKDFKFAYQAEYRLVWLPPQPSFALEPFFAEMGNIKDVASYFELPRGAAA